MKRVFWCVMVFCLMQNVFSADGVLTGKIVDQNSLPIAGVTVHVLLGGQTMQTDSRGEFSFSRMSLDTSLVLKISKPGWVTTLGGPFRLIKDSIQFQVITLNSISATAYQTKWYIDKWVVIDTASDDSSLILYVTSFGCFFEPRNQPSRSSEELFISPYSGSEFFLDRHRSPDNAFLGLLVVHCPLTVSVQPRDLVRLHFQIVNDAANPWCCLSADSVTTMEFIQPSKNFLALQTLVKKLRTQEGM